MKNKRVSHKSILSLLVKNYVVVTVFVLFFCTSLIGYFRKHALHEYDYPRVSYLEAHEDLLRAGEYDKINDKRLLGSGGFFEILDEDCNIIYTTKKKVPFTQKELNYLDYVGEKVRLVMAEGTTKDGKLTQVITKSYFIDDEISHSDYMVLDNEYNIMCSAWENHPTRLTRREYNIVSEQLLKGMDMRQYRFKNSEDKFYTMVTFVEDQVNGKRKDAYEMLVMGIVCGILAYFILIAVSIRWTYHNVMKPLNLLDKAIKTFEEGDVPSLPATRRREYMEIFESFSKMVDKLTKSEETRKRLEEERSQLFANLTHDLKTPITVIVGYSKAICDGLIPDNEMQMYFESIYQKAAHLSDLITAFAEYSKLEHPEFVLDTKPMDLCEVFRVYLAKLYGQLEIEGFKLVAEIPEKSLYCMLDEFHFTRVLENIVGNSIKYNSSGTTIFVKLEEKEEHIEMYLGDDGCGIPENIKENVFHAFSVGSAARNGAEGVGLGLAVARKIVESHNGTITLVEQPQGGWKTLYHMEFPKTRRKP
ncbi:MAG: HAMP domain-containing histidine kinase [Lachnospiraceae bacterium]|nr:HAMP domain-containing histidine kinase [Lachnospiraceae bacterium]